MLFMEQGVPLVFILELHYRMDLPRLVLGSQLGLQGMVLGGEMGVCSFFVDRQMGLRFMEYPLHLALHWGS